MNKTPAFLALTLGAFLSADSFADDSYAWLAGKWCMRSNGDVNEEFWLPPHGRTLIGMSRTLRANATLGFEYLRIVVVDGVDTYIAQPGGRPPTSFVRTDGGKNWVRFENPSHDFPKVIEYRRDGESLNATASGEQADNKDAVLHFNFAPCA